LGDDRSVVLQLESQDIRSLVGLSEALASGKCTYANDDRESYPQDRSAVLGSHPNLGVDNLDVLADCLDQLGSQLALRR
jgi:hypothetical protein